jgi:zinc/manganese transport system permease protein
MLFAENIGPRLAIGWTMGTLVSGLGVYLSLKIDLPTGATIVCTFALVLIAMALVRKFFVRPPEQASSAMAPSRPARDYSPAPRR